MCCRDTHLLAVGLDLIMDRGRSLAWLPLLFTFHWAEAVLACYPPGSCENRDPTPWCIHGKIRHFIHEICVQTSTRITVHHVSHHLADRITIWTFFTLVPNPVDWGRLQPPTHSGSGYQRPASPKGTVLSAWIGMYCWSHRGKAWTLTLTEWLTAPLTILTSAVIPASSIHCFPNSKPWIKACLNQKKKRWRQGEA